MRRFRRTRSISVLIGILCVGLVSTSVGAPGDIFQSGAPVLGGDAPSKADIAIGDATVSTQTGALQYGYPIAVPPGRAGLQPALSLGYSSQGSTYGSPIGAGWSLSGVHWIERDTRQGRLETDYFTNDRPVQWTSTLTGGRTLVEVDEPRPAGSRAYRVADGDGSYVRYQLDTDWRALTPDGLVHTFGEAANMGGVNVHHRFPQTSTVDGFGNRIDYIWTPVSLDGEVIDFRLDRIEYTSHPEAAAFARIEFEYERPVNCAGTGIPVGAELDYRTGHRVVRGADKLVAIRTMVRDPEFRTVREVLLDYYDDQPSYVSGDTIVLVPGSGRPSASHIGNTERCDAPFTPVRLLETITEIAHTPPTSMNGSALPPPATLEAPPVTFDYALPLTGVAVQKTFNFNWTYGNAPPALGYGFRAAGNKWPTVEAMLLDFDGDARPDRLMMNPDGSCSFVWQKNTGDGFEFLPRGPVPLPTLPQTGAQSEGCSLSGHFTYHQNVATEPTGICEGHLNQGSYLGYRFMDLNGDSLPELITSIHHDPHWFDPNAADISSKFGGWPACTSDPACPVVDLPCMEAGYECTRDGCEIQGDVIAQCMSTAEEVPCGAMFAPWDPSCDYYCSEEYDCGGDGNCVNSGPSCPSQRRAHQECGRYVWMIYWNHGNGALAASPDKTLAPIPLESESGDSNVGPGRYSSSRHSFSDIDGDGYVDAIIVPRVISWDPAIQAPPNWWYVFRGDGQGGFHPSDSGHPYVWNTPPGVAPSWADGYSPSIEVALSGSAGALIDMNGDGLPDLVTRERHKQDSLNDPYTSGEPVEVYYNTGRGFRTGSLAGMNQFARLLPTDVAYPSAGRTTIHDKFNDWIQLAERHEVVRTLDVDADGRLDFFVQDPYCASGTCSRRLLNNTGDGFGPAHDVPTQQLHDGLRRLVHATGEAGWGDWRVVRDLIDIDGDGQLDLVDATGDGQLQQDVPQDEVLDYDPVLSSEVRVYSDDYQGMPPRLLHRIENGRGGHVDIRYANLADPAVDADPTTDNAIPTRQWVVSTLTAGDAFGSPAMATSYRYEAPVWSQDPNTSTFGFRGFERVQTHSAGGAVVEERYGYDQAASGWDWSGRLIATVTYRNDSLTHVASISETTWQRLTLFSNQVLSYQPQTQRSYTCRLDRGEAACRADGLLTRTDTQWDTQGPLVSTSSYPAMWVATTTRLGDTDTGALVDGDRLESTDYELHLSADRYRLRTTRSQRHVQAGGLQQVGLTEHVWEDSGLWERQTITWRSPTEKSIAERQVDGVGNVVWEKRPNQVAAELDDPSTTGLVASFQYDEHRAHVRTHVNELGHTTTTYVDAGTGATLRTLGPNFKVVDIEVPGTGCWFTWPYRYPAGCGEPSTIPWTYWVESRADVDGFGRRVASYVSVDAGAGSGYDLEPIERIARNDLAYVNGGSRTSVETTRYIDFGDPSTAAIDTRFFDGHHRLTEARQVTSEGPDAVTTYSYDETGNLASFTVPSPIADGQIEIYSYAYDSLGQVTEVLRPDGAGRSFVYDGLLTIQAELVTDDGPAPRVVLLRDVFGRLREVRERTGTGASVTMTDLPATYEYDANDNLRRMVDADGVITDLEHDWVGNRTSITREGQRRWQYRYDADGNQVTRIAPVPDGASALDYTTSVVYDALGRPISKVTGRAGMSTANSALLGGGGYISYLYDEGPNGIGRLSFIRSFTDAGEELIEQSFAHDARGNVIENRVSFDLGPIGYPALADTRVVQQHHGASGQTTDVWYGDHPTKAGSSWVSHHYDRRGNLRQTYLETGPSGVLATNLRNVAGLVTAQSFGPTDVTWTYDSLGRVLEQKVEVESLLGSFGGGFPGGVVAAQTFDLHDSGDPRTLVNQLAGTQHTYAFQHDHQRQLVHAEGTDGFVQDLTYFQSGRIETNVVAAPTTPGHSVTPRDVVYEYGNQAESHQVTALLDEQGDDLARYTYDAAGNIVDRFVAGDHYQHVYDGYEDQRIVRRGGATELYFYDGGKQRLLALDLAGARLRLFHGPLEVHYDLNGDVDRTWAHVAHGGTTIRIEDRTTREWTVHSALRHALVTLDHAGQPTAAFSYAPFGERLASFGDVENHPRRFNDKIHNDSSGLAYYGYRYYDPLALIWTQADPLYRFAPDFAGAEPRRANLYAFSLNSPLSMTDPDGRETEDKNPLLQLARTVLRDPRVTAAALAGTAAYVARPIKIPPGASLPDSDLLEDIGDGLREAGDTVFSKIDVEAIKQHFAEKLTEETNEDSQSGDGYRPRDESGDPIPLPKDDRSGRPVPTTDAPHTQIGTRKSKRRNGEYRQTREFGQGGKEVKTTDWTDHGRPAEHPNPHDHPAIPNPSGGNPIRGKGEPMRRPE